MKKKNEIIVNAFYVHDEVIEEPPCALISLTMFTVLAGKSHF